MIIWVASYPRSGNTYLRQLIYYGLGVRTYTEGKDRVFSQLGLADTVGHAVLPAPIGTLTDTPEVYFVKTHDLPVDGRPAAYLVRDGRDAVVSHAHLLNTYLWRENMRGKIRRLLLRTTYARLLKQLIVGDRRLKLVSHGGWSTNVLAWTQRMDGPTVVIRYEDLLAQPEEALGRVAELAQLHGNGEGLRAMPDFASLHQRWPQFFRKGRIGAWREEMPEDLHHLFWQHHGDGMRALGYE